jgi:hypothetical protein
MHNEQAKEMPKQSQRNADNIADVVWGGVWAGLGCVFVGGLLISCLYFWGPDGRSFIEAHISYLLIGAVVLFLAGFGLTLQSLFEFQFLRGKWK